MNSNPSITIPFIDGDGIGPEIMAATRSIIDQAVQAAYGPERTITWLECLAGKRAFQETGEYLPASTLDTLRQHTASIKGPLTTPVGGGIRSLNVTMRQALDLYVCMRPVRWYEGLPSPLRDPAGMDVVTFRENTEDIYTGIEYPAGSAEQQRFMNAFEQSMPEDFAKIAHPQECGIGIKPISRTNSQRLVRAAIRWALENGRKRVSIVHKGNIMKYTEGAFRNWGYEVADSEFAGQTFSRMRYLAIQKAEGDAAAQAAKAQALQEGKIWVDDVIADVTFEQLITKPQNFDVLATTNLNGDYVSDAAAALAGGVGISPGANINFESGVAVFEANHGSADALAGQNKANPSSLILSAEMMLRYLGWTEAADILRNALAAAIRAGQVTFDLAAQIPGAQTLGTREFAQAVIEHMQA
ncbi:MAG: isocitrate dehydrogenase [Chloroflexota bacterium]|nr:isocitrate dehydrogenase [Chloroflexota bacterium]